MAITWSIHIRYSQHDSGLSSMLWNKSFLRILLRMKSTYALASETLKLRKIISIRMRIILQVWGKEQICVLADTQYFSGFHLTKA